MGSGTAEVWLGLPVSVKSAVMKRGLAVLFFGVGTKPLLSSWNVLPEPAEPKENLTSDTVSPLKLTSSGDNADSTRFVTLSPGGLVGCWMFRAINAVWVETPGAVKLIVNV